MENIMEKCSNCGESDCRYKCLVCQYNLCTGCYRKLLWKNNIDRHLPDHPMQLMNTISPNIVCDNCHKRDFRGRYRCMVCRNYDLCLECRQSQNMNHSSSHPMKRVKEGNTGSLEELTCTRCNSAEGDISICLVCHNYYLCYGCHYESKTIDLTNRHDLNHPMQLLSNEINTMKDGRQLSSFCDSCKKTNFDSRYKCTVCRDYDLCSLCHKVNLQHNASHPVQRIEKTLKSPKKGELCNLCQQRSLVGDHFRCLICHDVIICLACNIKSKTTDETNNHNSNHPMQLLKIEINTESSGKQFSSFCDYCQTAKFRSRYKCMICRDYDLCVNCHQWHQSISKHKPAHPMLRVEEHTGNLNNGFVCNLCKRKNAQGDHYTCLICHNYFLCHGCRYESKIIDGTNNHSSNHPMQLLKRETTMTDFIEFESSCDKCKTSDFRGRYKCMLCRDYDSCSTCHRANVQCQYASNHVMEYVEDKPNENDVFPSRNAIDINDIPFRELSIAGSAEKENVNYCQKVTQRYTDKESVVTAATRFQQCTQPANRSETNKPSKDDEDNSELLEYKSDSEKCEEKQFCSICLERPFNVVFLPCGHIWVCHECSTILMKTSKRCPACRNHINSVHQVYLGN